jgi:hypothetical protein
MTTTDTDNMTSITVPVGDTDRVFVGRWIVELSEDEQPVDYVDRNMRWNRNVQWSVALTAKGNVVVYSHSVDDGSGTFEAYASLDLAEDDMPQNVFAAAKDALGQRLVIDMDV